MTVDSSSNERAQTREERRLEKKERLKSQNAEQANSGGKRRRRIRTRLIPLWLRLIIILLLIGVSAILGAMVGYGVIGDGNPTDALDMSTWTYLLDLIEKE